MIIKRNRRNSENEKSKSDIVFKNYKKKQSEISSKQNFFKENDEDIFGDNSTSKNAVSAKFDTNPEQKNDSEQDEFANFSNNKKSKFSQSVEKDIFETNEGSRQDFKEEPKNPDFNFDDNFADFGKTPEIKDKTFEEDPFQKTNEVKDINHNPNDFNFDFDENDNNFTGSKENEQFFENAVEQTPQMIKKTTEDHMESDPFDTDIFKKSKSDVHTDFPVPKDHLNEMDDPFSTQNNLSPKNNLLQTNKKKSMNENKFDDPFSKNSSDR